MTVARSQLVDLEVTPYYHCISECVRGAHLCGEVYEHRKVWIEKRLEELAGIFALSVSGFSVMGSHLHVLVRLEGERGVDQWSDPEVAERWGRLYPPRGKRRKPIPVTKDWIKQKTSDRKWIERTRQRLANLGWFMKCLKEPLARMANKEDECRGAFWASRYKSIAILDTEALLATCAYIDLNPFAAGIAESPETSEHTSIKARVDHCREQGRFPDLCAAASVTSTGTVLPKDAAVRLEDNIWLCPFAEGTHSRNGFGGMLAGFSLANYLLLLDQTSRLVRDGKKHMSQSAASLLERLGTTGEVWQTTITKMFSRSQLLGVAFSFSRDRLRAAARRRGCNHLINLNGCPA